MAQKRSTSYHSPDIGYYAPSYRRAYKSITQENYPFVKLVVSKSEEREYKKNGNDVVACPDKVQGNLCRVRNWILDNFKHDAIVLMDDDIKGFYRWENRQKNKLNPDGLRSMCDAMHSMALDSGVRHCGINCVIDKRAYREMMPFCYIAYISGPFSMHIKSPVRYDERLALKEDYDMTLQHLHKYGKVLRFNMFHCDPKQSEQEGGCATYRNLKEEKRQFLALQKKWGSDIVTQDKMSKRSFDYNPILKFPIKGT